MESLMPTIFALLFFVSFIHMDASYNNAMKYNLNGKISSTITVDKGGQGNYTTVKQAVDSIPSNNSLWIRILLNHGIYVEKIVIPEDKPYIILEGDPKYVTVIEYGDAGDVINSPTFKLQADNFVARNIMFKNTYDHLVELDPKGKKTTRAPAASITGDKASFHHCSFISLQDTLHDGSGRHYFEDCFIEGAIDFIWGNGQSIYEKCQIKSLSDIIGRPGYITAQGRDGPKETTGYVFKDCYVNGTGPTFLGRAWRPYSRVLFASTYMENIVCPQGWSEWQNRSLDSITFSEVNCEGPGADMSHRVPWEKKLSNKEVAYLTNPASFIDQDGWLEKQPK